MATYYWVGGAGTWNSVLTTNWASSSGGAGGAGIPTATDDVIFDTSSGTGTISITASSAICNNFTITATQALTFSGTVSNVKGSFSIVSGGSTVTTGLSVTFTATTSGNTVTTNGHSISGITFNGAGGAWTLGSALTLSGVFTWTNGTFNTGNYNITSSNNIRYLGTGTATINLGSSTVTTSGFNVMWDFTTTTGLTFNAGTSTIVFNSNSIKTFAGGGLTYYNVQFTGNATNTINNIQGANTFNNLLLTGPNTGGAITFTVNSNQIINGTLTANGVGYSNRLFIKSTTIGTRYTITSAVVSMSYIDFSDIAGAGTGVWAGTSIGDAKNNTGITFDTPKTVYWNLAGAQNWNAIGWSLTSGGTPSAANFPLAQDTAIFDNTGSVTGTITLSTFWNIGTVNMSARTSAMTLAVSGSFSIYGDWTNGSGTTLSITGTITFANRSSQTITSNGKTFTQNIIVDSGTGTVSLVDDLTTSATLTLTSGTFDSNNRNVNTGLFASSNSNTRTLLMGSGTWTISGTGTVWNTATITSFTLTPSSSTIVLSNTSATARTFAGGGKTYNNLVIGGATGTSTLTFTGSNTFNTISSTKTVAHTILFTAGTTTTVSNFTVSGTSGNVVTIGSVTAASHTLTKTGGGTITVDYASISRSTATPSTTWYATNSTNGGNNSGWTFGAPPSPSTNSGRYFLLF